MRRALAATLLAILLAPTGGDAAPPRLPALRVGLGARISPRETFPAYEAMFKYIGKKVGRKVDMVMYTTYAELDLALERLDLDFAFLCSGPYVRDRAAFGLELLAAPRVNGAPLYYSYLLVPKGSPARKLADLRGGRFAFVDPKSNTGRLVPTYLIAREFGVAPEAFFGSVKYTWSHDAAIDEVAAGTVDGAAIDSLFYDYLAKRAPARVANVRVLLKSIPFGIPPFVATKAADPRVKRRFREVLLAMHEDPDGRRILDAMLIERFVVAEDANYDGVRDMEAWLAKRPGQAEKGR